MIEELIQIVSSTDDDACIRTMSFFEENRALIEPVINQSLEQKSVAAYAALYGRLDTFIALMDIPSLDIAVKEGEHSLLYWAALNPSNDILSYILRTNTLLARINDNTTPLHIEAFNENLSGVKALLHESANCVDDFDTNGHSALFYAALLQNKEIIDLLKSVDQSPIHQKNHQDSFCRGASIHAYHTARIYNGERNNAKAIEQLELSASYTNCINNKKHEDYYYLTRCYEQLASIYFREETYIEVERCINFFDYYYSQIHDSLQTCLDISLREEFEARLFQINFYKSTIEEEVTFREGMIKSDYSSIEQAQFIAEKYGFVCQEVPDDGECFFHAVYHEIAAIPYFHEMKIRKPHDLRMHAVKYIQSSPEHFTPFLEEHSFARYISNAIKSHTWADELTIRALSKALRINLVIFSTMTDDPLIIKSDDPVVTVYLININNRHFQILKNDMSLTPVHSIEKLVTYKSDAYSDTKLDTYLSNEEVIQEKSHQETSSLNVFIPPLRNLWGGLSFLAHRVQSKAEDDKFKPLKKVSNLIASATGLK